MKLSRYWTWLLIGLIFLVFFFFSQLVNLYVDWQWFKSVKYFDVFFKILLTKGALVLALGLIFFAIIYINLVIARRFKAKGVTVISGDFMYMPELEKFKGLIDKFVVLGVALFSILVATGFIVLWDEFLKFANWTSFGTLDPLFAKDIGFYIFRLPFIKVIYGILFFAFFISVVISFAYYFLSGNIKLAMRGLTFKLPAEVHLSILGTIIFALISYGYRLAQYDLLFSKRGIIFGAGYTDVHATLPVLWGLIVLSLVVSLSFIFNVFRKGFRLPLVSVIVLIAFSIIGKGIYPGIVQWLYVSPNEIEAERPYIERNIKNTRKAFKLDNVIQKEFAVSGRLTTADLRKNSMTVNNIRLWDHRPLLSTYSQIQEIRTYYHFVDVDVDRYKIGRDYREVMLSPRELSYERLPSKVWINEHLIYTHGYGVAMSPVNRVNPEGQPELWIKDLPPVSSRGLKISRPEIYYGEIPNEYCFVKTKQREFDYPLGEENVYSVYEGSGGIPVRGMFRRAMFASRFGTMKILLSGDITTQSRIMMYRRVRERVGKIAPFLKFDPDPYMVIADGKLYWIIDGYTLSNTYPYSDPYGDLGNYIRNSVKVIIDAYNGTAQFYISDPEDPVILTYSKIFKDMFKPIDDMPASIRSHIRYPEGLFKVQADKFAMYHMTDPTVFYNKEDLWSIARETYEGDVRQVEPYYIIMKLPGEKKEEFILMIPFTPSRKDNMSAWMAARSDDPNYGGLMVYTFGKKELIYGPLQVEARIDQDPDISKQLSLWGQRGSDVIRGNMLVIPIENSILYVEPLYLRAERGQIPELKRVIVSFGGRVAMEETLDAALRSIFGGRPVVEAGEIPTRVKVKGMDELIKEANEVFSKAQQYQRQGNWAAYGEEMEKLEGVLKKLGEMSR